MIRRILRKLWLSIFPHPAPASGDTWLPPPAHSAKEGWSATPEDGPPLNARLCDCTERERQEWKAPHRGPLYGRPACPSYVEGSGTPPRPACTCGKGDSPGWEHRWPTPAHGTFAAQPGCPRWSRSRKDAAPPAGGTGVRPAPPPPAPGPMLQEVDGRVVTDQEAAILRGPPSEHQASALFRLYGLATGMLQNAPTAAVPGTNPGMSPGHDGDSPGTDCAGGGCWCRPDQYPEEPREIRAYRRALVDGRCASAACPGKEPGPTPEEAANGTCHPDPDHGCTARRPPRPAPTPVPGPGRKQSR